MPQGQEAGCLVTRSNLLLVGLTGGGGDALLTFLPSPRIKSDTHSSVSEGELFQDPRYQIHGCSSLLYEMVEQSQPSVSMDAGPTASASLRSTTDASGDMGMCSMEGWLYSAASVLISLPWCWRKPSGGEVGSLRCWVGEPKKPCIGDARSGATGAWGQLPQSAVAGFSWAVFPDSWQQGKLILSLAGPPPLLWKVTQILYVLNF